MAMAVRAAQLRLYRELVVYLVATMVLGTGFLGVKAIEYTRIIDEHLIPGCSELPGPRRRTGPEIERGALNPGRSRCSSSSTSS